MLCLLSLFMDIPSIKHLLNLLTMLASNARGAAKKEFLPSLRELIKLYKLVIIANLLLWNPESLVPV